MLKAIPWIVGIQLHRLEKNTYVKANIGMLYSSFGLFFHPIECIKESLETCLKCMSYTAHTQIFQKEFKYVT